MKTRLFIIVLSLFFTIGLGAQEVAEAKEHKTKKELRQERREAKKREREEYRLLGKTLLESKNFVLKVDRMQNAKGGALIPTVGTVNFIKIDGENVTVQFGDVESIGLNGVGGVTYNGILQNFEMFDRGEGKSVGVRLQYTSVYAANVITVNIEINGDQATARFNENGIIINMYGQFEPFEGSSIWEGQNRRDF